MLVFASLFDVLERKSANPIESKVLPKEIIYRFIV